VCICIQAAHVRLLPVLVLPGEVLLAAGLDDTTHGQAPLVKHH
jgi:hypothetical protein